MRVHVVPVAREAHLGPQSSQQGSRGVWTGWGGRHFISRCWGLGVHSTRTSNPPLHPSPVAPDERIIHDGPHATRQTVIPAPVSHGSMAGAPQACHLHFTKPCPCPLGGCAGQSRHDTTRYDSTLPVGPETGTTPDQAAPLTDPAWPLSPAPLPAPPIRHCPSYIVAWSFARHPSLHSPTHLSSVLRPRRKHRPPSSSTSNSNARPLVTSIFGILSSVAFSTRQHLVVLLTCPPRLDQYISDSCFPTGRHNIPNQNQARAPFPDRKHKRPGAAQEAKQSPWPVSLIFPFFTF